MSYEVQLVAVPDTVMGPLKKAIERAGGVNGVLIVGERDGSFKIIACTADQEDTDTLIKCAHDVHVLGSAAVGGHA